MESFKRTSHSTALFHKVEDSPIGKNVGEGGNAIEKKGGNVGIILALFFLFGREEIVRKMRWIFYITYKEFPLDSLMKT